MLITARIYSTRVVVPLRGERSLSGNPLVNEAGEVRLGQRRAGYGRRPPPTPKVTRKFGFYSPLPHARRFQISFQTVTVAVPAFVASAVLRWEPKAQPRVSASRLDASSANFRFCLEARALPWCVNVKRMQWLFPTRRYGRSLAAKRKRLEAAVTKGAVLEVDRRGVSATPPKVIGAARESAKPLRKVPRG